MEYVALGAGAVIGLAAGWFGGRAAGLRLRERPSWQYWAANAAVLVLGVAVAAAGRLTGFYPLAWTGLGFVTGGLSGLKYGLGRVIGQWREDEAGA